MNINDFFLIFLGVISTSMPIILIKKYIETKYFYFVYFAIISYLILIYVYSKLLLNHNISIIYPLLKILSIILVIIIGVIFFKDTISIKKGFGILFGLISIFLLLTK
jgi:multidrug transporter EmrE-like cation transporter